MPNVARLRATGHDADGHALWCRVGEANRINPCLRRTCEPINSMPRLEVSACFEEFEY